MTPRQLLDDEQLSGEPTNTKGMVMEGDIVTALDISHLVIEDDTPVDSFESEKHPRLLVDPLYSSDALPSPFLVAANIGLFYQIQGQPIVPDVMLSLNVQTAPSFADKRNRSYFVWEFGKVPEVCIEIVSNQKGDELSLSKPSQQKDNKRPKPEIYAQIGVHYYVVFDPQRQIQGEEDMGDALLRIWVLSPSGYQELTPSEGINEAGQSVWLDGINLGLTLWEGCFEDDLPRLWLRWCDRKGQVIFTGAEGQAIAQQRAEAERQRADRAESQVALERQRAERLAKRLRTMGLDPDEV